MPVRRIHERDELLIRLLRTASIRATKSRKVSNLVAYQRWFTLVASAAAARDIRQQ
jgi:hypothetical protein